MSQVIMFLIDDVHLEHRSLEMKRDFANALSARIEQVKDDNISPILLAAGDIDEGLAGLEWLKQFKCPIVYTCGNHEFWNQDYFEILEQLKKKVAEPGYQHIHFLYNESIELDKIRFVGASLWTDLGSKWSWWANNKIIQNFYSMADFKKIKAAKFYENEEDVKTLVELLRTNKVPEDKIFDLINKKLFNPLLQLRENQKSFNFIKNTLNQKFDGQTVVLTHHLPVKEFWMNRVGMKDKVFTAENVNNKQLYIDTLEKKIPRAKNILMMGFYVNDFKEEFFNQHNSPELWVHGHFHQSVDGYVGKTRIASSPVGHFKPEAGTQELNIKEIFIDEFGSKTMVRESLINTFSSLDFRKVNDILDNFQSMIASFDVAVNNGILMSSDFQPVIEIFEKDLAFEIGSIKKKIAEVLDAYIIIDNLNFGIQYDKDFYIVSRLSGMHLWLKTNNKAFIPLIPEYYSTEISFSNNVEETLENRDKLASQWLVDVENFREDLKDFKEAIVEYAKSLTVESK